MSLTDLLFDFLLALMLTPFVAGVYSWVYGMKLADYLERNYYSIYLSIYGDASYGVGNQIENFFKVWRYIFDDGENDNTIISKYKKRTRFSVKIFFVLILINFI